MTLARFVPADPELEQYGRVGEDVEIIGPAHGQATGLAFVVHGVESGATYLAWADELVADSVGTTLEQEVLYPV